MSDGQLILVAAALLAAGIGASLLASRIRLPGLLLFLAVGMAVGSDGLGWINFADYELARTIGVVALALILFEGGLTAGFHEIRPVLRPSLSLAIVGTVCTAVMCGLAAAWLFDLSTLEGMLLGAIISSTDGAAIFALLRESTLRRKLARTLEGEAGFNDPVAVLLVIGFIEWIQREPDYGVLDLLGLFVTEMGIGAVVGLGVGWAAVRALRNARLASPGLYPVATLATAGLAFGGAATLHGSGFLAAYLAGLMLGSARIPAKQTVTVFHEGLAWVAQITMFLALGLLVFPSELGDVWFEGTLLALLLVFVARPLSAALATAFESFSAAERIVIGWAGLRGAVPVVLATFAVIEGVPEGHTREFFNIVFFAVVISTILQGTTVEWLARKLGVTTSEPALPRPLVETGTVRRLGAEIMEYPVGEDDAIVGQLVRELGLPRDALLSVIVRGEEALLPRGSTRIEAADRLHVLVREEVAGEMTDILERWRLGPVGIPPRRRPLLRSGSSVFTTRPWTEADGDAGFPREIEGAPVAEHVRTRRDTPGALVVLEDGRSAVTGPLLAIGGPLQLQRFARRRLATEQDAAARAWWQEVIGALAR
ncbi:MAG TPA: potassium/proton antiporter [Thermoleophilaceae bacterium]|jgi:cell volume regulation protein A|nr:potassium/proton antiporter [Thermoleophilaceae bacterium]